MSKSILQELADKWLFQNLDISQWVVKEQTSNRTYNKIYVVYITRIAPFRRQNAYKYGYTGQIWSRLYGLRKKQKVTELLHLFIFPDKTSAILFENYIKEYVDAHKFRPSKNKNMETLVIESAMFNKFVDDIKAEYSKRCPFNLNNDGLVQYIECCNNHISTLKLYATPKKQAAYEASLSK